MSFRKLFRSRAVWIAAACAVLILVAGMVTVRGPHTIQVTKVPFSELLRDVERGAVAEVVVDGDALLATMTDGRQVRTTAPSNYVTANPSFVPDLMKRDVRIDVHTPSEDRAFNYAALVMAAVLALSPAARAQKHK